MTRNTNTTTTIATAQRDRQLEHIARTQLDVDTLESRHCVSLDCYHLPVRAIRAALNAAYSAGYEQAVTDREPQQVPETDGCPRCSERDPDRLVWNEAGDEIACHACGTRYSLPKPT